MTTARCACIGALLLTACCLSPFAAFATYQLLPDAWQTVAAAVALIITGASAFCVLGIVGACLVCMALVAVVDEAVVTSLRR